MGYWSPYLSGPLCFLPSWRQLTPVRALGCSSSTATSLFLLFLPKALTEPDLSGPRTQRNREALLSEQKKPNSLSFLQPKSEYASLKRFKFDHSIRVKPESWFICFKAQAKALSWGLSREVKSSLVGLTAMRIWFLQRPCKCHPTISEMNPGGGKRHWSDMQHSGWGNGMNLT